MLLADKPTGLNKFQKNESCQSLLEIYVHFEKKTANFKTKVSAVVLQEDFEHSHTVQRERTSES